MKRALFLFALFVAVPTSVSAQSVSKEVLAHVRSVSVSVVWNGKVVGSGTVFRKGEETWVLTAKHVIQPGDWKAAGLSVARLRDDGRVVGIEVDAVEMSEDDDFAWLRACPILFPKFAVMRCGDPPPLDTPLVHCGSMGKQHQTVTRGYLVGINREDGNKLCDQISAASQGGSSGGGVFMAKTGEFIGFVHCGIPPHVVFIVPARRITCKDFGLKRFCIS